MDGLKVIKEALLIEANALNDAALRLNSAEIDKMTSLFRRLQTLGGNLVISGVGKSGLVAQKIASTFSSLGLSSYFLHPIEALHGDLGRVSKSDALILISNSGTTEELLKLLPYIPISKENIIGFLGNRDSVLATKCGILFDCGVLREACINNQAPTTSTTVAIAMGDAIAVLYESIIGLSKEGFAQNHPGGLLGKSLALKVEFLMMNKNECPFVEIGATLQDAILQMTKYPSGMCVILENDLLKGVIVEGDIRRFFATEGKSIDLYAKVDQIMNKNPITIAQDVLAFDALKLMEDRENQISVLPVVKGNCFVGQIRLHDLLKEGFRTNL